MKKLFKILIALTCIMLDVACVQNPLDETNVKDDPLAGKTLKITAIANHDDNGTKTTVTETGTDILWQPNDQISVFYGPTLQGSFKFDGTKPVAKAVFEGALSVVTGAIETPLEERSFWGVYPHRNTNTCSGTSVTTIVPDHQTAVASSFDPASLVTVAQSSGLTMAFYNVCAGVKFSLTQERVREVQFHSNDDTPLAGVVTVSMDALGHPVVSSITNPVSTIYLTMPGDEFFEVGKWYYLTCLPGTLESGFTMTFLTETKKGEFTHNDVTDVKRSVWGRLAAVDDDIVYKYYDEDGIITFADEAVKAICVANWDIDGDGELSYDEAAAVDDILSKFSRNTTISSFEELRFFTGLSYIYKYAFDGCSSLSKVTIPSGVTSIGQNAFYGCRSLKDIDIPSKVTSIGKNAFYECSSLTGELKIPKSISGIEEYTFYGCKGFTGTLCIPDCVTSIGNHAFDGCSGLTGELIIPGKVASIEKYAFNECRGLTSLVIQEGVNSIGERAFYQCKGLSSATIPSSVTSIGDYAFYQCSGLKGIITIPEGVTRIGDYTFYECSGLAGELIIPEGVESIGTYAFCKCRGLTGELIIPESVKSIGWGAFCFCTNLTGVTIPNGVTTIGENAFYWCAGLTGELIIPGSVDDIGNSAFYGCKGISGLTILEGVKSIGDSAFYDCNGLTDSVTIPSSVTSIGNNVFSGKCRLKKATVLATDPPKVGNDTFNDNLLSLYVPAESVEVYKMRDGWNLYASRIRAIPQ